MKIKEKITKEEFNKKLKEIRDSWLKAITSAVGLEGSFIKGKYKLSDFDKEFMELTLKGISADVIKLTEKYDIKK